MDGLSLSLVVAKHLVAYQRLKLYHSKDMAQMIGITNSMYESIITGLKAIPTLNVLCRISEVIEVPLNELVQPIGSDGWNFLGTHWRWHDLVERIAELESIARYLSERERQ